MALLCITTETSKCIILHYDTHYEYLIEIGFRILNDVHYQSMLSNVYGRNVSWHPTAYIPLQRKTSRIVGGGGRGFALDNTSNAKFYVGYNNRLVSKNPKICVTPNTNALIYFTPNTNPQCKQVEYRWHWV